MYSPIITMQNEIAIQFSEPKNARQFLKKSERKVVIFELGFEVGCGAVELPLSFLECKIQHG